MEHSHAHHNDHEGPQGCDHVHRGHAPPLLEEDDGGGQHHGGEEDIVDRVDQLGVEGVQGLVQVVHLSKNKGNTTELRPLGSWFSPNPLIGLRMKMSDNSV